MAQSETHNGQSCRVSQLCIMLQNKINGLGQQLHLAPRLLQLNSVLCLLQVLALCGTGDHNNE